MKLIVVYMIIPKIGAMFGTGIPLMRPKILTAFRTDKPTIARGKNFTIVSFGDII